MSRGKMSLATLHQVKEARYKRGHVHERPGTDTQWSLGKCTEKADEWPQGSSKKGLLWGKR